VSSLAGQEIHVSSGKVVRHAQFPSQFVTPRNVDVWLPAGYSAQQEYAVIYMHDGQMLFDSTNTWNKQEWKVDEVLSKLMHTGEIRNTIVVGIWNVPDQRHREYFPEDVVPKLSVTDRDTMYTLLWRSDDAEANDYLSFITRELKPFIDANYSTYGDRKNTFIGGSSMGGLISLYAICKYPGIFGGAICMSTHWPGALQFEATAMPEELIRWYRKHLPDPQTHRIYFDHGTTTIDQYYGPYQQMMDRAMQKKGYDTSNWKTEVFEAAPHTEVAWSERLHIPMTFLLR